MKPVNLSYYVNVKVKKWYRYMGKWRYMWRYYWTYSTLRGPAATDR